METLSLKERAQMLTSSLVWGGPKTFEQIKELDWLKTTSEYGIYWYIREAENYGWVKTTVYADTSKPNLYLATAKGRKMAEERD